MDLKSRADKGRWRGPGGCLSCLLLAAGCASGSEEPSAVTVRDSAGVRIVESSAPRWATASPWRIASQPEVEIGTPDR